MFPKLNSTLESLAEYASKSIAQKAKGIPGIDNLSIGEPDFGPPNDLIPDILEFLSSRENFLDSVKRYERSRGSKKLREAIAQWYYKRYGLQVDPDTEILITHGGVEGVVQSILSCSENNGRIAITDPSYMLYERSIKTLGRKAEILRRPPGVHEFADLFSLKENQHILEHCDALIINSPENPSGYMLSGKDWQSLSENSIKHELWIIHDEVYDTMAFARKHVPVHCIDGMASRSIVVNSFSKKFGVPGLRIGWVLADKDVIDLICKSHDYLYLGVNILFEELAVKLLEYEALDSWLKVLSEMIADRMNTAIHVLNEENGFQWPRKPMGGMFLFPRVINLYNSIPDRYKTGTVGESVSDYLLNTCKVSTVPGIVYGAQCADHIRLVLCSGQETFDRSTEKLSKVV